MRNEPQSEPFVGQARDLLYRKYLFSGVLGLSKQGAGCVEVFFLILLLCLNVILIVNNDHLIAGFKRNYLKA